jgi:hypothetical protein
MSDLLTGVLGFAALFALWGVYGLSRPRRSCSAGGCGSCASADRCELAHPDTPEERTD